MSRLIDADLLIDVIKNIQDHMREANKNPVPVDAREIFTLFIEMIEKQTTAYDLKAVVNELEDLKNDFIENMRDSDYLRGNVNFAVNAIEIVRNGGAK